MSDQFVQNLSFYAFITLFLLFFVYKVAIRLRLSVAKHPSLRGHSKWSRRLAKRVKFFEYTGNEFFAADGANNDIAMRRQNAMKTLEANLIKQSPQTYFASQTLEDDISDVQFTSLYRVPFPFRTQLPQVFKLGSLIDESRGVKVKDLDNVWRYDLSGSYGVNVFGYDFYKSCIEQGSQKVAALGPALGSYHPLIADNVKALKKISGLDEVSFHMSGTEAVMQAVRLARYHTKKTHLVRFCGAYHGWWDGVQPGVGNRRNVDDVYTLADLSDAALKVLETRNDIACVLINPLQAFHPNADSASDATLIASDRKTAFNRQQYSKWLQRIQAICQQRHIVLIFDEVFTGFRLGYRGAQEYFDVQADLVTYGKTLGGGLPVGVLCGRKHLMKRFTPNLPVNVSLARGTFNSHPYVIGAMHEFLQRTSSPEYQSIYKTIEATWQQRVVRFNERLAEHDLPLKIESMHTILSVVYLRPSRYNWMLQFYLRAHGLELSWLGTGRFILSFNFTETEFDDVVSLFIAAANKMRTDGWWSSSIPLNNKIIKRAFLNDMLTASFPSVAKLLRVLRVIAPIQMDAKGITSVAAPHSNQKVTDHE